MICYAILWIYRIVSYCIIRIDYSVLQCQSLPLTRLSHLWCDVTTEYFIVYYAILRYTILWYTMNTSYRIVSYYIIRMDIAVLSCHSLPLTRLTQARSLSDIHTREGVLDWHRGVSNMSHRICSRWRVNHLPFLTIVTSQTSTSQGEAWQKQTPLLLSVGNIVVITKNRHRHRHIFISLLLSFTRRSLLD